MRTTSPPLPRAGGSWGPLALVLRRGMTAPHTGSRRLPRQAPCRRPEPWWWEARRQPQRGRRDPANGHTRRPPPTPRALWTTPSFTQRSSSRIWASARSCGMRRRRPSTSSFLAVDTHPHGHGVGPRLRHGQLGRTTVSSRWQSEAQDFAPAARALLARWLRWSAQKW